MPQAGFQSEEQPTHSLRRGTAPLLISIPHLGTQLPEHLRAGYVDEALQVPDTDWHLDRLYAFAHALGATVLGAKVSRYVIDLNRPPTGESLYPGQATTGLCPTTTFHGRPLYRDGCEPDASELEKRIATYWQPYHAALHAELARLRARHAHVLLWEAHSIASVVPRLFQGKLPDFNFGTNSGASCDPALLDAALAPVAAQQAVSHVVNGRFKGGYITRRFGQPASGVHAIQLEMCQSLYMDETVPFDYRPDRAAAVQPLLQRSLSAALAHLERVENRG